MERSYPLSVIVWETYLFVEPSLTQIKVLRATWESSKKFIYGRELCS